MKTTQNKSSKKIELEKVIQAIKTPQVILSKEKGRPQDYELNKNLMETIEKIEQYSGIKKANKEKERILKSFNLIVDEWIDTINKKKDKKGKAKLFVYGSHTTGSALVDDDVDILIMAPEYVERDTDFFGDLYSTLESNKLTSQLIAIGKAIVPIIKLDFNGVKLDIGFSSGKFDVLMKIKSNTDKRIFDDSILLGMDENTIKSFNAFRNAHLLAKSLEFPNEKGLTNFETRKKNFKTTTLMVKLWAKRWGIYSAVLGYFGGISLAVLVAKICQLYPNYPPSKLMERFFFIYQFYPWEDFPLMIMKPNQNEELDHLSYSKAFFNPDLIDFSKPGNKRPIQIITPAYPFMNCTYNISDSQMKKIDEFMTTGFKIVKLIELGELVWNDLFLHNPFFHDHDYFIEVEILSKNEKEFYKWKGLIQARLRYLIVNLEAEYDDRTHFYLWPKEIDVYFEKQKEFKYASFFYIGTNASNTTLGLKNYTNAEVILNLTQIMKQWRSSVYEQWIDPNTQNRVYFFNKHRVNLDEFVFKRNVKGFYTYKGDRALFPDDSKIRSNLLNNLMPGNFGNNYGNVNMMGQMNLMQQNNGMMYQNNYRFKHNNSNYNQGYGYKGSKNSSSQNESLSSK